MKIINKFKIHFFTLIFSALYPVFSQADESGLGVPTNWGIDLQNPISAVAKDVYNMHFFVLKYLLIL